MDDKDNKARITFPSRYVLKVTAIATLLTLKELLAMVKHHVPEVSETNITVKNSSQGKYVSFSVSFMAESQEQLDALYRDLTARKEIVFVL
ncbi:MAG: hypothetical protein K0R48_491 [Gammaproteobacteria bacterium]|nr:hypothetical protein [Gammaproteobacteria bacterium]